MIKYILTVILILAAFSKAQVYNFQTMDSAVRNNDKYFTWIYFTDKDKSLKKTNISQKTLKRRNKADQNINFGWYDTDPSKEYIEKILQTGAQLRQQSRWLNAISIECTEKQISEISYMPFVKEIRPVHQYKRETLLEAQSIKSVSKSTKVNDTDYGNSKDQIEQINVNKAHEAGYFGQGVTVLILDTGYNLEHPVFDSLNIIAEWDFINNDSITANEKGQDNIGQHNHGTATFSALGGYAPGTLVGPAYKADFLLAKTEIRDKEIQIEEDYYVAGLEWGESRGAEVASSSLGYTDWYLWENMDGNTAVTTNAVDIAVKLGMVCVTSAGNENGKGGWNHIIAPADADSVISVGAVNSSGIIANFSSRGPSFDGRIKPEVCARGVAVACAHGDGISYYGSNGTSLSAPLVAGAAAIILSAHPDWTPMMVREALMQTASQSQNANNEYGWGIIDTWSAINYSTNTQFEPELNQNYPNPFNSNTTIEYEIRQSTHVKLIIFDILGREVITLVNSFEPSGMKNVIWNGKDKNGYPMSSGVYIYKLITDKVILSNKLVYIK